MAQDQQYEIWVLNGEWVFRSSWRDFEVGLAAARSLSGPVRIMSVSYNEGEVVERSIVVELGSSAGSGTAEVHER